MSEPGPGASSDPDVPVEGGAAPHGVPGRLPGPRRPWTLPAILILLWGSVALALWLWPAADDEGAPPVAGDSATVPVEFQASRDEPGSPAARAGQALLRVAVAPVVSPEASLSRYRDLVEQLGAMLGLQGVLIQRTSYADVNALLHEGRCDLAFVCTYPYVIGAEEFGLVALAVPVVRGRTHYKSLLIVPAASDARSIMDTRGGRLASADILSNTGWLYPAYVLAREGEDIERFFAEITYTGGHDRAIRAVASGYADIAAVDSLVYEELVAEEPAVGREVRIVGESGELGMPPVVAPPSVGAEERARLRAALLSLHETPEGRRALDKVGFERFAEAHPEDYDEVRAMGRVLRARR